MNKSVLKKLFSEKEQSVELSEVQKVELALVDDFQKEYENALNIQAKAETSIINYNDLASKIISTLNDSGKSFLKANARFQEIEQMAKELGVDVSPQLKSKKDNISAAIKEIDSYIKKLTSNKVNI